MNFKNLKDLRTHRGDSQSSVAAKLGMTRQAFASVEKNYPNISIFNMRKITARYDCSFVVTNYGYTLTEGNILQDHIDDLNLEAMAIDLSPTGV